MFAGFRREDPLPVPEIAIPVGIAHQVVCIGLVEGATPKETMVGDLTLVAFYYLLQVGEYTRKKGGIHHEQFSLALKILHLKSTIPSCLGMHHTRS